MSKTKVKVLEVLSPDLQDSTRDFKKRLTDFGPELGSFLNTIWKERATIDLDNFDTGTWDIYKKYSGGSGTKPYDYDVLKDFLATLQKHAGAHKISPQGMNGTLDQLSKIQIKTYGKSLWTDFFHVLAKKREKRITSRVYVHASSPAASLEIMKVIIDQFEVIGLDEVKTAGPGCDRKDTIIAYLYSEKDAADLIETLKEFAAKKAKLFVDELPPLIKRAAAGVGTADEPPGIRIDTQPRAEEEEAKRHSFGSFYSILIWLALKCTPNVLKGDKDKDAPDGRHMLDYMLYSLRLLQVKPADPQHFPKAAQLEAWYHTVFES